MLQTEFLGRNKGGLRSDCCLTASKWNSRMTLMRQNYKYVGKNKHKKEIPLKLSVNKTMQKTVALINASLINNFLLLIFLALLP